MFKYPILAVCALLATGLQAQKEILRTIEVSGESQITVDPDEILFTIVIEEYWKEEFEGKKWEEYRTKIPIEQIERKLVAELKELKIDMDRITLKNTGNYWRQRGKDFLINKQLELRLDSFEQANSIANHVQTRGIKSMSVTELKHKNLDKYKTEVKKNALKAAKKKAEELVETLDMELGTVVNITEIDQHAGVVRRDISYMRTSNAMMEASVVQPVEYENFRKITLKAAMRVVWEVKASD